MAAELILRADASREEWEAVRKTGLGGSDAGAIMGMNKWKSPYTLWAEKTGLIEPDNLSDKEVIYWGTVLEEPVARRFAEVTGKKIMRRGTLRSTEHPFMHANVDRMIVGENAGLEIKTTNAFAGKDWDGDEIPDSYYCQCLHYMAVTGAEKWYIAALIGGNHFVWKEIPRNEDDIRLLIEKETEFWEMVQTKTPPPVDGTDACAAALAKQFHGGGDAIELPTEAAALFEAIDGAKQTIKEAEEQKKYAENALKEMLGDSDCGTLGGRKVTWKEQAGRETVSVKDIKKEFPDSYEALKAAGIVKIGVPTRVFRVK